ncbi:MAG: hypothetical protein IPH62_19825 [Ignavibacteriae bacterium]|nr:hypothetical protein [Ignavibacteriota bacterium]
MNSDLKDPFRFSHEGVKEHFIKLIGELKKIGFYDFGSSGDGEITVKGNFGSVYIRKIRKNPNWRLIYRKTLW